MYKAKQVVSQVGAGTDTPIVYIKALDLLLTLLLHLAEQDNCQNYVMQDDDDNSPDSVWPKGPQRVGQGVWVHMERKRNISINAHAE